MAKTGKPQPNEGTKSDTNGKETTYVDKRELSPDLNEAGQLLGCPTFAEVPQKDFVPLRVGDFANRTDYLEFEILAIREMQKRNVGSWTSQIAQKRREIEIESMGDSPIERIQQEQKRQTAKAESKLIAMILQEVKDGTSIEQLKELGLDCSVLEKLNSEETTYSLTEFSEMVGVEFRIPESVLISLDVEIPTKS